MKLTNLEPATNNEVKLWLMQSPLKLTDYQTNILADSEMVRFSPFYFYKRRKTKKVNILWRLSIIAVPVYFLLLIAILPFTYLIRGEWGYGQKFFDNFHAVWFNKLNL